MTDPFAALNATLEGRYTVEREIGAGGMATVYLAEDHKHRRKVALKVLKPELAAVVGGDRFLAEIETTANLQHPNILPLFDSGSSQGVLFYVMPFVEGKSLRDRLDSAGQLPVDDAVRIVTAVATALGHAHRQGVVHRDIKPANILLQDGQPVVADFGISIAIGAAGGSRLTETGLSMGTPYYMSPEQATGDQTVGPSSDIYALACVLYEALIGEPPYPGPTAQAVLGKIISGEGVAPTKHRSAVPPNVDAAIRKSLERLPADRFASAEDFAKALGEPSFRYGEAGVAAAGSGPWKRVAIAALAAAGVLATTLGVSLLRPDPPLPVSRYAVGLPQGHDIGQFIGSTLAVSPDGSIMAYVGPATAGPRTQLWVRRRDQLSPTPVPGTEDASSLTFSPDGGRVAFVTVNPTALKTVTLGGEPPLTLADEGVEPGGVTWGADGYLYIDTPQGLGQVPETGGDVGSFTPLAAVAGESSHVYPSALPNGRGVIFAIARTPFSDTRQWSIATVETATLTVNSLLQGVYARYSPSGHILYVTAEGTLLAAPFDQDEMELTGPSVALAEGVAIGQFGSVHMGLSDEGTLAYASGGVVSGVATAVWVDRDGTVSVVDPEWEFDPGAPEVGVELSPDGSRAAVKIVTDAGEDIWVKELDAGPLSRLTFDEATDRRPRWTADGRSIMFNSARGGQSDLWVQPADGTGSAEVLLDLEQPILEVQRSPDEEWFVLRLGGLAGVIGVRDLVGLRVNATETVPLAAEPYDEKGAALSPDGRWLAYESNETGEDEIYVRPFPNVDGGKWQVSTGGGVNPRWAHGGRELFYVNGNAEMVAASVELAENFRVGSRETLFSLNERLIFWGANYAGWDVGPDDQRFFMVQFGSVDQDLSSSDLIVVENFFAELNARVGG